MARALFDSPWSEPFKAWSGEAFFEEDKLHLAGLNALATREYVVTRRGQPLRFVEASSGDERSPYARDEIPGAGGDRANGARDSAAHYEWRIGSRGEVLTRTSGDGCWHDFYNALIWIRFPKLKSALNDLQLKGIDEAAVDDLAAERRGRLRDRVTLFDECGALVITHDRDIVRALAAFDWNELFVLGRERFRHAARVVLVGHALHDKLRMPYKGVCAQAIALDLDARSDWRTMDAAAAHLIAGGIALREPFMPLPVLGVPGWWAANEEPSFYNDPKVFRSGRRER